MHGHQPSLTGLRDLLNDRFEVYLTVARTQGRGPPPAGPGAGLPDQPPDYVGHVLASHWTNYSKEKYGNRMFKSAVAAMIRRMGKCWNWQTGVT